MDDDESAYPLFKGATRSATILGVPVIPLIVACMCIAPFGMIINPFMFLMAVPVIIVMRAITQSDDKAFRILWLWFQTDVRNPVKRFWGSSSYSPVDYSSRK